eukprot:2061328-Alexandrium_andersonii.AAC.1
MRPPSLPQPPRRNQKGQQSTLPPPVPSETVVLVSGLHSDLCSIEGLADRWEHMHHPLPLSPLLFVLLQRGPRALVPVQWGLLIEPDLQQTNLQHVAESAGAWR